MTTRTPRPEVWFYKAEGKGVEVLKKDLLKRGISYTDSRNLLELRVLLKSNHHALGVIVCTAYDREQVAGTAAMMAEVIPGVLTMGFNVGFYLVTKPGASRTKSPLWGHEWKVAESLFVEIDARLCESRGSETLAAQLHWIQNYKPAPPAAEPIALVVASPASRKAAETLELPEAGKGKVETESEEERLDREIEALRAEAAAERALAKPEPRRREPEPVAKEAGPELLDILEKLSYSMVYGSGAGEPDWFLKDVKGLLSANRVSLLPAAKAHGDSLVVKFWERWKLKASSEACQEASGSTARCLLPILARRSPKQHDVLGFLLVEKVGPAFPSEDLRCLRALVRDASLLLESPASCVSMR